MAINRRDLIVRGGATAAALTAGGAASASAQTQQIPAKWDRDADVVVIGGGATRPARGHRRARSRLVGDPGRGAAACRRPCARLRRQRAARRRHQRAEEIRHRGFARPGVQGPHRLVGRAAQRRARLPLQRPRDHPRLRRQLAPPTFEWLRRAWRRLCRQAAGPARRLVRRQLGAAHHALRADGLAADPDRQAGDAGAAHHHVDRQRPDAAARRRRAQGRRAVPARAQDDVALSRERHLRTRRRRRRRPQGHDASTCARARRSSSPPAARPATSTSAACSIRA